MQRFRFRLAPALFFSALLLAPIPAYALDAVPARFAPAQHVEVDAARIHYTRTSAAPEALTLVLLHGFGASLESWHDLHPLLAAKFPVVRLDLLGHGFSDKPANGDYTPQGHARYVTGALAKLGLQRVVLVGHSMGGSVALLMQMEAQSKPKPFDIAGMVLISSAGYPQKLPFFVETLRDPVKRFLSTLIPAEQRARFTLEQLFFDKSLVTPDRVQRYAYFTALPGYYAALTQTALHIVPPDIEQHSARIKQVKLPTLILWGERDRTVPVENAARFHQDIAGSRLRVFPNTGHMPPEERPAGVAAEIEAFVAGLRK